MSSIFSFTFPAQVRFGVGAISTVADHVKRLWATRVLIITDRGVVEAGLLDSVTACLTAAHIPYDVFDEVTPNPTDLLVEQGATRYRSDGHDVLIALGGGSVIDAAKGLQVRITHPGHIRDYFESGEGARKIIPNMPRMIAIPTTAGTGSETTAVAVLTDTRDNTKKGVSSPFLRPAVAIVDPALTVPLPPSLTAATGLDALTHCIEAYASTAYGPIGKSIALGGIELIREWLVRAVEHGDDLDARMGMSMAAVMGGLAFGTGCGLGAVHSLAHQLSTEIGLPHGLANAILLPHVMAFNATQAAERYVNIARALGVDTAGMSAHDAALNGIEAVYRLYARLGIPRTLRAVGLTPDRIPRMAHQSMLDSCHRRNPRPCTEGEMVTLYEAAF